MTVRRLASTVPLMVSVPSAFCACLKRFWSSSMVVFIIPSSLFINPHLTAYRTSYGRQVRQDPYINLLLWRFPLVYQGKNESPLGIFPAGLSFLAGPRDPLALCLIPLACFLEIYPKLGIGPVLIDAGTQVLLDVPTGKHMAIDRLEGQHAVHKHVRPGKVYFVADVPLGVVRL